MLVSRDDSRLENAVQSIARQDPAEIRAYIDSIKLVDDSKARKILSQANAKIFVQTIDPSMDRHTNLVHNLHRGFLEAEKNWIVKLDDDDELLDFNRKQLIRKYGARDTGFIHGNKRVKTIDRARDDYIVYKSRPVRKSIDLRTTRVFTSSALINTLAFKEIHPMLDHGYFCDWKIFYWILRAGWKTKYIAKSFYLQNWTPPGPERKALYGKWPAMIDELDQISLEEGF